MMIATSTAVERTFSKGRQLLHFTCNRLSGRSVHQFLSLGAWSGHDMIKTEMLVTTIAQSAKGKGRQELPETEPASEGGVDQN